MNSLKKVGMWGWFAIALVLSGLFLVVTISPPVVEAGAEYWLAPWTWGRAERAAEINSGLAAMTSAVRLIFGATLSIALGATIFSYRASAEKLKTAIEEIATPSTETLVRLGALEEGMTELRQDVRMVLSAIQPHSPPSPVSTTSTVEEEIRNAVEASNAQK